MEDFDPDLTIDSADKNNEEVTLAKADIIYKQKNGFDLFQMNRWGGGSYNEE